MCGGCAFKRFNTLLLQFIESEAEITFFLFQYTHLDWQHGLYIIKDKIGSTSVFPAPIKMFTA